VLIATDDLRIADHVRQFGAEVVMTPEECRNGTERLVAALELTPSLANVQTVVNVQGDEPALDPEVIDQLVEALHANPEVGMATPTAPIASEQEWLSPSIVKAVSDLQGRALYFSRAPIGRSFASTQGLSAPVRRHVGIYAYRRSLLEQYACWEPTPLQVAEDLEQLKILENGYPILLVPIAEVSIGVDHPEDIHRIEALLQAQGALPWS
jgi:3-deoxy-manno-octulosonate cytidylyltransferase (CMP-KDO synthetase)